MDDSTGISHHLVVMQANSCQAPVHSHSLKKDCHISTPALSLTSDRIFMLCRIACVRPKCTGLSFITVVHAWRPVNFAETCKRALRPMGSDENWLLPLPSTLSRAVRRYGRSTADSARGPLATWVALRLKARERSYTTFRMRMIKRKSKHART